VFFRDILHLYGVFLMVWNYLTPIFYPESLLEKYKILLVVNPLYFIIKYFREIILYGTLPSIGLTAACIGASFFILILGMFLFYRRQDKFILYI
jgi:ABC-2 type transport system permease protein